MEWCSKVLERDPGDVDAICNMAELHVERQEYEEAIKVYQKAGNNQDRRVSYCYISTVTDRESVDQGRIGQSSKVTQAIKEKRLLQDTGGSQDCHQQGNQQSLQNFGQAVASRQIRRRGREKCSRAKILRNSSCQRSAD